MGQGIHGNLRRMALWAMLSPFFLLSLLNPSVMPARSWDGTVAFVLCTSDGPIEIKIDPATGKPVPKAPDDAHGHCAWASARAALAEFEHPGVPALAARITRADPPPAVIVLRVAAATGHPPATGPPPSV